MNILNYLYYIFIGSLEYVFDFVFTIAYYLTNSAGLSIIALSVFVNLIMMPIRKKADEMSKEEKDKQVSLKPWVDKIKKAFKGDEQYMILQTYYRQNNYKPIYSLKSSISLIIQIPFFIAAYHYLNNSYAIDGASFLFIKNLSIADGMLYGFNLLPILMTIISIVSNIVFTKGSSIKENYQLYLLSLLFLVILYNAPSGLVMYYLLNNTFSLIKSLIEKIPNYKKIIKLCLFIIGAFGFVFVIVLPLSTLTKELVLIALCFTLMLPLLFENRLSVLKNDKTYNKKIIYISEILLIIILGLYIPSNVIGSSPIEFSDDLLALNPNTFVFGCFCIVLGLIGIWLNVMMILSKNYVKKAASFLLPIISIVFLVNYMFFGNKMGKISDKLVYLDDIIMSPREIVVNLIIDLLIAIVLCCLFNKRKGNNKISILTILVLLVLSSINIYKTNNEIINTRNRTDSEMETYDKNEITINLSNSNNNVIIIVLDRAINSFFPFIIEEDQEIKEMYSDFTYYPNTISFGSQTTLASPALYGGYDYTMYEMNKITEQKLVDKHNEALMTLPVLFSNNGYEVTVFDQQFANYEYIPDFSIYDDYEHINAYNVQGKYDLNDIKPNDQVYERLNMLLLSYGITKCMPLCMFNYFYNYGMYNNINKYIEEYDYGNMYVSDYLSSKFYDAHAVLSVLPNLINVVDDKCLFIMHNMETHEPQLLQMPNYETANNVDNSKYINMYTKKDKEGNILKLDTEKKIKHYCVNFSSLKYVGFFLDELKKNNMYDNSRIIIVSDHGEFLGLNDDLLIENDEDKDIVSINPLLLVKDFNTSQIETRFDYRFMTNADVPEIALSDIVDNPLNPFTNKLVYCSDKASEQIITFSTDWYANKNIYYRDIDEWYTVKDNIFDLNNWQLYTEE